MGLGVRSQIADWTMALVVFLGAFVIAEPAPYELLLAPVIVVWALFGLKLNRHILPLIVLLLIYIAGGFLALTQLPDPASELIYVVVTFFLALSAIFFAAVVSEAPERRFRIIKNAYIASALVASLLAIVGYFHLVPGSDVFLLYGRAKSTFQDPNVFAPFLVLPIVLLYRDILTTPLRRSFWKAAMLLVLLFAVFLAFSRAAWGMTVFTGASGHADKLHHERPGHAARADRFAVQRRHRGRRSDGHGRADGPANQSTLRRPRHHVA